MILKSYNISDLARGRTPAAHRFFFAGVATPALLFQRSANRPSCLSGFAVALAKIAV
jgi:hypothetical protein